jgi:hypothetical protein
LSDVDKNTAATDDGGWEGDEEDNREKKARDRRLKKTDIRQCVTAQRVINKADGKLGKSADFQKRKAVEELACDE